MQLSLRLPFQLASLSRTARCMEARCTQRFVLSRRFGLLATDDDHLSHQVGAMSIRATFLDVSVFGHLLPHSISESFAGFPGASVKMLRFIASRRTEMVSSLSSGNKAEQQRSHAQRTRKASTCRMSRLPWTKCFVAIRSRTLRQANTMLAIKVLSSGLLLAATVIAEGAAIIAVIDLIAHRK